MRVPNGLRIALATLAGLALATSAHAEWTTAGGTLLHPGAAVLTGAIDDATTLTVSCTDRTLGLTLSTRDAAGKPPAASGEGTLRIVPDTGNWSWLQTRYRQTDGALVVEATSGDLRAVVEQIVVARSIITYIVDFVGGSGELRWNGDAAKSTAAGRAFLDICFNGASGAPVALASPAQPAPVAPQGQSQFGEAAADAPPAAPATTNQFGQPAAAAPAASGATQFGEPAPVQAQTQVAPAQASQAKPPTWSIAYAPDPNTSGQLATLTGDLGHFDPGWLFVLCDGAQRPGLSLISNDRTTFPFSAGDELYTLSVGVDGAPDIEGYASYYVHDDRFAGVRLNDPAGVRAVMRAIAGAADSVSVTIVRTTDRTTQLWASRNLDGLAEAAAQFNRHCYGAP